MHGNNINWKTEFEIYCDPTKTQAPLDEDFTLEVKTDECKLRITIIHSEGCPMFEATSIIAFFDRNPAILGVLLIVVGFVSNFFGGKFFNIVFAVVSGITVFIVSLLLCSVFGGLSVLDKTTDTTVGNFFAAIFCFLLSAAFGVLIGYLTTRFKAFGISLLGGIGGFILGFWFHTVVLSWISRNAIFALIVSLAGAIGAAGYTFYYSEKLGAPMTSIVGSYMIIRGASMFIGYFPG